MSTQPPRRLAEPFPEPSPVLAAVLDELRLASTHQPESEAELRHLATLPRPWDPPTCPPELRQLIYSWLDNVVAWINQEHTWRTDRVIPSCWQDHPHIVHELATVACLRWEAGHAVTPTSLEDWHRYSLSTFLDRIAQRIGTSACPPGKHQPFPVPSVCTSTPSRSKQTRGVDNVTATSAESMAGAWSSAKRFVTLTGRPGLP